MSASANLLKENIRSLRRQLFRQILQRDELLFIKAARLEAQYMQLFAAKECAAYYLNTQLLCQNPNLSQQQRTDLFAQRHKVWLAHMQHRNNILLKLPPRQQTARRFGLLNYYYARCVRLIHPDLYPTANLKQRQTMYNITLAYKNHELPLLAIKPEQLQQQSLPAYNLDNMCDDELAAEQQRLQNAINNNIAVMQAAEQGWPLNLQPLLQDAAACAARQQLLDELLRHLKQQLLNGKNY